MMAIGQLLSGVGAGMANGGGIGGGIQGLNRTLAGIQENERAQMGDEEERQYRRLEMELKRKQLEQKAEPQSHVLSAGGMLVGPDGKVLARADTAKKDPTSIEAALFSDNPEVRARAEELRDKAAAIKGTPTEHQRQELELSRKRLDVEMAKLNRPTGSASAPAPTQVEKLIKFRQSLAPDDPNIPAVDAAIKKETSFAPSSGGTTAADTAAVPGYAPATAAAKNDAAKKIEAADAALTKLNSFAATFKPELQTAASSASTAIGRMLEWAGVPSLKRGRRALPPRLGRRRQSVRLLAKFATPSTAPV